MTPTVEMPTLTADQLAAYDGSSSGGVAQAIYVALSSAVYDVSSAANMYGPGGSYHVLAGKDATAALATMNMSPSAFEPGAAADLTAEQMETLQNWKKRFNDKYKVVAKLQSDDATAAGEQLDAAADSTRNTSSNGTSNGDSSSSSSAAEGQCPVAHTIIPAADGGSPIVTFRECPLGYGSKKKRDSHSELPRMTLETLAAHAGSDSPITPEDSEGSTNIAVSHAVAVSNAKPRLISVKGKIYDVSNSGAFRSGGPLSCLVGHDASRALATSDYQATALDSSLAGLSYDEHKHLEQWSVECEATFPLIALLAQTDYDSLFDSSSGSSSSNSSGGKRNGGNSNGNETAAAALHACIAAGDVSGLEVLLQEHKDVVNSCCTRTKLSPLHKAVEANSVKMTKALLQAGGSTSAKADLYDGDTPLELAKRLKFAEVAALFDQ